MGCAISPVCLVLVFALHAASAGDNCGTDRWYCKALKRAGGKSFCLRPFARRFCKNICGHCYDPQVCKDADNALCNRALLPGGNFYCRTNRRAKENCKASCGLCDKEVATPTTKVPKDKPTTKTPSGLPDNCKPSATSQPRQLAELPNGIRVVCDTVTDGGNWVIFQRRTGPGQSFVKTWQESKDGFGDRIPTGDFWLGNENLHTLCPTGGSGCELRIDITTAMGSLRYAVYSSFTLSPEAEDYRLNVAGKSATGKFDIGDVMRYYNGMKFSAADRDNDLSAAVHCGTTGGWWHLNCVLPNFNSVWTKLQAWMPLERVEMKVRMA